MIAAPMNRNMLRKASEADAPNVDLISVVSAARRETSSPERASS
jgi:hypothetical protein